MKFGHSLLTSELRGSAGGLVASVARGGIGYFRARVRPGNPRTTAQSRMRLILTTLAGAWTATLNDIQRAGWTARAGTTQSGIDTYIKVNSHVLLTGQARVDDPPVSITLANPPLTAISLDASANTIGFTNSEANDDYYVNVFASSSPQHSSRLAQQFPFTYIGTVHIDTAGPKTISVADFPALAAAVAGDVVYLRFVQVNINGGLAAPQETRSVVVA